MKLKQLSNISKKLSINLPNFVGESEEGIRLHNMLLHSYINQTRIALGEVIKDVIPSGKDIELVKRLMKTYKQATKSKQYSTNKDIWGFLKKGPHADFIELLDSGDIREIAFYLCNMSRMGATHGLSQGKIEYDKIIRNKGYRTWLNLFNLDKLMSLAEALGVLSFEDPEQGDYGNIFSKDPKKIINAIEKFLGVQISMPILEGGLYKLIVGKNTIHNRDITSIYTAWRCKEILRDEVAPSICEIGAGLGKTAYYSYKLGIRKYTIIDLPYVNFLQGFYLIKSLPLVPIVLYGETSTRSENYISILPTWSLGEFKGRPFDLTLNQDSFPEIQKKVVLGYLKQIKHLTKKYFLSINQESRNTIAVGKLKQHVVFELINLVKGYRRLYRSLYWLRQGYVEELYQILQP